MTLKSLFEANLHRIELLVRYYGVGVINTVFGYGLYAGLIFIGLNLFVAQIIAHVSGATFNYFTYSRHVFHDSSERRPVTYIVTYAGNYVVGVGLLATAHHFVSSPYLAGFVALMVGTAINFFILRRFVFPRLERTAAP
jgi:putative flippase GtrA